MRRKLALLNPINAPHLNGRGLCSGTRAGRTFRSEDRLLWRISVKGKILNGEKANKKQWSENAVIQNVIKILGLKHGVKYTSTSQLRYGHVLIMSDQDIDGFHIRGLVKSIFSSHWKELLTMPGLFR